MRVIKVLSTIVPVLFLASASLFTLAQPATPALSHIDPAQLQLRWVFHSRNATFSGVSPTIVGNVVYVSTSIDIYAIDAISGGMIWHYVRQTAGSQLVAFPPTIRSILIRGNRLYSRTEDAHFIALDTRSGNLFWDVAYSSSDSSCNTRITKGTYASETQIVWWQLARSASAHGENCVIALDGITGKLLNPRHSSSQVTPSAAAEQLHLGEDSLVLTPGDSASLKTLLSFNLGQEPESQTAGHFMDGRPLVVVTAGKDLFFFGQD